MEYQLNVWKDIPGYEGNYKFKVSDQNTIGEVYNIKWGRPKKPCLDSDGYYRTTLCKDGVQKSFSYHQISALIYLSNPENKTQINHKFGNKADNRPSQIEWCTIKENNQHAFSTGLKKNASGVNDSQSIPILQFSLDGIFIKEWGSISEAGKTLKICNSHISKVCKGVYKQYRGFKWEFKNIQK